MGKVIPGWWSWLPYDFQYIKYLMTDLGQIMEAQKALALRKEEIEPPWVVWRGRGECRSHKQGVQEYWWNVIWHPFWNSLTSDQRLDYFVRWSGSNYWRFHLLGQLVPDDEDDEDHESELDTTATD